MKTKMTLTPQEWLDYYTKNPKHFAAFLGDVNEQSQELFRLEDATAEYHKLTEKQAAEIARYKDAAADLLSWWGSDKPNMRVLLIQGMNKLHRLGKG